MQQLSETNVRQCEGEADYPEQVLKDRLIQAMDGPPRVSQTALAKVCGVSGATVNDWRSGKTRTIKSEHLIPIARFLGVSAEWLATGKGPMRLNDSGAQEKVSAGLPAESRLARLDHATFTQAKRFVLAEETLAGPYPRDELVDQVFAVYDLMAENGGALTHQQREGRFAAARLRHSEGDADDNELQRGKTT